jgi:hypothetical protein
MPDEPSPCGRTLLKAPAERGALLPPSHPISKYLLFVSIVVRFALGHFAWLRSICT